MISSAVYLPMDNGNKVVTSSRDHTIKVIDIRMYKVLNTYENENYYNSNDTSQIGVSPSGRYLALGSKNGKLIIMDILKDEGVVDNIFDKHSCAIVSVDWSRRTSCIASVDTKGNLLVWN